MQEMSPKDVANKYLAGAAFNFEVLDELPARILDR